MTPTEDREFEAVAKQVLAFLHEHGYDDAAIMPDAGHGAFDIGSAKGIAEVTVASPPNRPEIQRLDGVARAEERPGLFFSVRGFTASAIEWADNIDIALFAFERGDDRDGDGGDAEVIVPVNPLAERLMAKPPTREEAILAAASRALEHAKQEAVAEERRKNADPETLKRVEEAKQNRVRRKDLLD